MTNYPINMLPPGIHGTSHTLHDATGLGGKNFVRFFTRRLSFILRAPKSRTGVVIANIVVAGI